MEKKRKLFYHFVNIPIQKKKKKKKKKKNFFLIH